ncbi:hypothetical protein R1flu_006325 [Riccia fluitans]|uniref:non-specific serine/threonine protein kinase n=1 Tax=Riccia fluitans TaxID=41844 RepID=A0ABD1YVQ0_9MARC
MSRATAASTFHKNKTLNDKYLLGDEIGKGAYGRVYKGLDLENGDFVAIKQVSLENIPSEDLASIMQEIDLLKNLNHQNIVKYQGSFKTKTHLYIILEYVENGSLANIIKPNKFGAFPEQLVAVYIAQVLEGLVYLHEQGVIHRDIKGANILTTKEGLVKLADFGVATKLTEADVNTHSVVGTPYWMAPEVIEMSGVSAASDIWSVGCTVIELLTCVPPYYDLQPMPALFRIVQDDHPPIPEHVSAGITDFLHQCFRKDAKLRPDAKTLLKHPWIRNSRRALKSSLERTGGTIKSIPQDVSTVVERSIEDGEKEEDPRPPSKEGTAAKDLFGSGLDEVRRNSSPSTTSETASSSQKHSSGQRSRMRMPRLTTKQRTSMANDAGQSDSLDVLQPPLPNAVKRLTVISNSESEQSSKAKATASSVQATTELPGAWETSVEDASHSAEEMGSFVGKRTSEIAASRFSETATHEEHGEEVSSQLETSIDGSKIMARPIRLENGSYHTPQSRRLSTTSSLSRFIDTPADGSLDDLFDDSFTPVNNSSVDGPLGYTPGATSQVSVSRETPVTPSDSAGGSELAAKLKAKIAQRKEAFSAKKDLFPSVSVMDVVEDDDSIDIPHLAFGSKEESRDFLAKQAVEIQRLGDLLKPDESEESVVLACQKLVAIFREHPKQKGHLISQHGIIPLMDMLDVNNNRVIQAVLQLINEIIKDNVDFQENACLAGLIPMVMNFVTNTDRFPREMRIQSASFIREICLSSPATLQMFIACRGLPVLVSFLEPDYAKYREMVHLAIDVMWQVLELQSSTPRSDFCKIFAKSGVLNRLVQTLYNLNEATRLASSASRNSGNLVATAPSASVGPAQLLLRTRSGPLEQSRPTQVESFKPRSGQLDPARVRAGYMEQHRQVTGLIESSRPKSPQSHKSAGLPEYIRHLPGQLDQARLHGDSTRDQGTHEMSWHSSGRVRQLSADREYDSGQSDTPRSEEEEARPLLGREEFARGPEQAWYNSRLGNGLDHGHHDVQPLLSLLEKEPPSRVLQGEFFRHSSSGAFERSDSSLPQLLHHAAALRKGSGKFDAHSVGYADNGKQNGNTEPILGGFYSKPVLNGTGTQSPSKLSPTPSAHLPSHYGSLPNHSDTPGSSSGTASQRDSGHLSNSGAPSSKPGSSSSPGLSRTMSTVSGSIVNADTTREYVTRVADLLLEFSRADKSVKSHMCQVSLLIRLFGMLNKLEPVILVKILRCIKELSTDPDTLENLQRADAMKHLVPFLEARDGPLVSQIHNQVLNALYNLCKINKRRQEQAAECDIIVHLMYFIKENSPLRQFALPLLCDMAHASRYTREKLRAHRGLEVYLNLLDDENWAVTALDSLAVCLAHDNEQRKVETALLTDEAVQKLVTFFENCGPAFVHILEPFLKIITKSVRLNTALAVSGLTPLLVARLDHQDAIARLNLLKLIKAVYEHHPRPKQLIAELGLPQKLNRLVKESQRGERSGGQVPCITRENRRLWWGIHDLWALFYIFFSVASGLEENVNYPLKNL